MAAYPLPEMTKRLKIAGWQGRANPKPGGARGPMKRLFKACQVGRANDFANLVIFPLDWAVHDWPDMGGVAVAEHWQVT